jgi:hypothetical protein
MSFARFSLVPIFGLLPLLSFGCSDPVPATPRGAFFLRFVSPSFQTCPINTHEGKIGSVTATTHDRVLVDGEEGAAIDCRVSGSGPFSVQATASQATAENAYGFTLAISSITGSATQEAPATGSVSFSSTQTGGDAAASATDEPCIFFFNTAAGQGVSAGKIWVSFTCSKLQLDMSVCEINEGHAIFENCET